MDNLNITSVGERRWFDSNGQFHRVDGPAIEWPDGYNWWYLHDHKLTFDEWLDQVDISDEDKVMMKLKYG
jgi:hypothetical protein